MVHTGPVRRRPALGLALAALLAAAVVACSSSDGRSLPPPRPGQTTTTPSTPVIQPSDTAAAGFTLVSTDFLDTDLMPERLTCRGAGTSPALSWTGVPEDAVALALVVRDLNAGGFVHWVVTGIDPSLQGIGEGGLPEGAVEGPNGAGTVGWTPPCPPAGSGRHHYTFQLLALPAVVIAPSGATGDQEAKLLETSATGRATVTAVAEPGPAR